MSFIPVRKSTRGIISLLTTLRFVMIGFVVFYKLPLCEGFYGPSNGDMKRNTRSENNLEYCYTIEKNAKCNIQIVEFLRLDAVCRVCSNYLRAYPGIYDLCR